MSHDEATSLERPKKRQRESAVLLAGEIFHPDIERRVVPNAGSGAFVSKGKSIDAGTLLVRAVGFTAQGFSRNGVFEDMLMRLNSLDATEQELANTLLSKCRCLCPELVTEALVQETGWHTEMEAFEAMLSNYRTPGKEDVLRSSVH